MATLVDSNDPPILEAVKLANIHTSFKYTTFARNDASEQFNHVFWKMGVHLLNFFKHFSISSLRGLKLTREVLTKRD